MEAIQQRVVGLHLRLRQARRSDALFGIGEMPKEGVLSLEGFQASTNHLPPLKVTSRTDVPGNVRCGDAATDVLLVLSLDVSLHMSGHIR